MIRRTLGGDRLGSGKRMTVEMHGYERSTHDLSYIWRSSMAAGTLIPFLSQLALPGDTWDIELETQIMTHPTLGPLFGSYKVQLDIFCTPIRLYNSWLHNNKLNIGMNMQTVKLPQYHVPTQFDNNNIETPQINSSALMRYLGLSGNGVNAPGVDNTSITVPYNAIPLLAYWDIFKNYYANKQEDNAYVIHTGNIIFPVLIENVRGGTPTTLNENTPGAAITIAIGDVIRMEYDHNVTTTGPEAQALKDINIQTSTGIFALTDLYQGIINQPDSTHLSITMDTPGNVGIVMQYWQAPENTGIQLAAFPLQNLDTMREQILGQAGDIVYDIDSTSISPYSLPLKNVIQPDSSTKVAITYSQEGIAVKTYNSDLFNNWIQSEVIEAITSGSAIDTSGGSFTMDTLNMAQKIYNLQNRIAASGGTYDDWVETVWAAETFKKAETPMYMGGLIKELVFQEIVSNAASNATGSPQPLGTLAGRGTYNKKHKGGQVQIKVTEPSYITGIISLTPRVDYSQGNQWDLYLQTMDDFHKPELDEIGFQDLLVRQMAWFGTQFDNVGNPTYQTAGKQPAWINYMTNVNKTYGSFAEPLNEMFMTLNRRYEGDNVNRNVADVTTYIDPSKYNFIFAQTSLDSQNFWTQIGVNMTVRRKMSAKIIPNL